MSGGNLHVRTALDEHNRVHFGPLDPVQGKIYLRYDLSAMSPLESSNLSELFGRLQLEVRLRGVLRITHGVHHDTLLFTETVKVHNGPFRASSGNEVEFTFSINFPEHADPTRRMAVSASREHDGGRWNFRQRLTEVTVEQLPPTLLAKQPKSMHKAEVRVEYSLSTRAKIPNLNVAIHNLWDEKLIHYDLPRVPQASAAALSTETHTFRQRLAAISNDLTPEYLGSKGIMYRMKEAILSVTPPSKYAFFVSCSDFPRHLFIGQSLSFKVSVETDHEQTTVEVSPQMKLVGYLTLVAETKSSRQDLYAIHITEVPKDKEAAILPEGPIEAGMTKKVVGGIISHLPSTFSHPDASRSYKLRVILQFLVAGECLTVTRQLPVTLHPPINDETLDPGLISYEDAVEGNEEQLPSYTEAINGI